VSFVSSLNVHGVKRVTIEAERECKGAVQSYATRTITIETDHGQVEITLFSSHKTADDEDPFMAFVV